MRQLTEAVVHCSATRPDWMADAPIIDKRDEITLWHTTPKPKGRGWSDNAYHFILDRDGSWIAARPIERVGAHVKGHNATTIGICLIGGHGSSANDDPLDHFRPEQLAGLRELLDHIKDKYSVTKVTGHNDYANKACPGFNVQRWLDGLTPERETPAQSTTLQASGVGAAATATTGVTAVSALDGTAQIIAVVGVLIGIAAFAWIFRERIKKWARGVK